MKVNYDIYPILQFLDKSRLPKLYGKINYRGEDGQLWNIDPDAARTAQVVVDEMYQGYIASRCSSNVYILMPKFIEALNHSGQTFKNISRGTQMENLFEDCCILAGDMAYFCYKLEDTTYLGKQLNTVGHPNNYVLSIYYQGKTDKGKERTIVYLGTLIFSKENEKSYRIEVALLSTWLRRNADDYNDVEAIIDAFLAVLLFKHYAKVELDVVHGGERKKSDVAKEKVINETPRGVHIMDSDWFTTIYRTEGYEVCGHIRYYKKYDKITFVRKHERKQYIRRAKILDDPTAEPDTDEYEQKLRNIQ